MEKVPSMFGLMEMAEKEGMIVVQMAIHLVYIPLQLGL